MKREDAVSLLKEIMGSCPSFLEAQAVSLFEERSGWGLSVFWVPHATDGNCLEKIIANRHLEVATLDGRMTFRSRQK